MLCNVFLSSVGVVFLVLLVSIVLCLISFGIAETFKAVKFLKPYIEGNLRILHFGGTKITRVDEQLSKIENRLNLLEKRRGKKK